MIPGPSATTPLSDALLRHATELVTVRTLLPSDRRRLQSLRARLFALAGDIAELERVQAEALADVDRRAAALGKVAAAVRAGGGNVVPLRRRPAEDLSIPPYPGNAA